MAMPVTMLEKPKRLSFLSASTRKLAEAFIHAQLGDGTRDGGGTGG